MNSKLVKSFMNAIVMILSTLVTSIMSLVAVRFLLEYYGSDLNGTIATGNQLINILLVIEGGVSLAINVSLFKPYIDNNYDEIDSIMSAAKKTFFKIGVLFLVLGILISYVYVLIVKSNIDKFTIFVIFLYIIVSSAFNLGVVVKYRIMYQVSQKEYKINFVAVICNLFSNLIYIYLLYNRYDIVLCRTVILLFSIINGFVIIMMFKKDFKYITFKSNPDYSSQKGTKDIIVQKFLSVIYTAYPTIFISTFLGTIYTSVYAVYYSILNIIRVFLQSVVLSPINGFGQLLAENLEHAKRRYLDFEYIVIFITTVLIASLIIVIIPFIKLYTQDISDVHYTNYFIGIVMSLTLFFEIIHLPAGNIINLSGKFKTAKRIQSLSTIVMIVLLLIGGITFSFYGILSALLITNIVLCIMEIYYTHIKIFSLRYLNHYFSHFILIIATSIFAVNLNIEFTSYLNFFIIGVLAFICITIINILINLLFNKQLMKNFLQMIMYLVKKGVSNVKSN